jgi:small subunit ribosomal protein S3Ae
MAKRERVAKRIKDKWRAKSWYTIHAPEMFNRAVLGETPAEDPSKLLDRVAEVTVQDLTGDFSKMHIKVKFKIDKVKGNEASTVFIGHDMTADYIRRLTRRKRSRIDGTFDVKTKDAAIIRVKPMAITDRRIQSSKQSAIRKVMHRVVYQRAVNSTLSEFVRVLIMGDMAREIAAACKSIQPIFRVEIRKSEMLKMPEAVEEVEEKEEVPEEPAEEVEEAAPAS